MINSFKYTKNDYEFRIFALRRSGSNAIVNWIINHFNDDEVYYLSATPKEFLLKEEILRKKQQATIDNYKMSQLKKVDTKHKLSKNKRCLMYKFEDCRFDSGNINQIESHYYGQSKTKINIIILRDIPNMTASRMAYYLEKDYSIIVGNHYKELVKQYLKEFCYEVYFHLGNTIVVNYNKWFSNIRYRMALSHNLNLKFTDKGLNQITKYGIGSSFDGKQFQGQAQQMDVFNRWQKYQNNPIFKSIVNDPEIKELNYVVFGDTK